MTGQQLETKAQEWRELAKRYANDPEILASCMKHIARYEELAKEKRELEQYEPKY